MRRINRFFDINCMVGVWPYYKLGLSTAAELDEQMRQFGIAGAAVSTFRAYRDACVEGNRYLFDEIAPYGNMNACPHLLPMIDGEEGYRDTADYLDALRARKVKMVRVNPRLGGFCLTAGYFKKIFDYLARHKMPLLVDVNDLPGGKRDVETICMENPELRLVVLNHAHEDSRGIYFLLRQYSNLYFETSFLSVQSELEQIVDYAGSRGLLFGTRMPHFEPGRMVARMTYSDLSVDALEAICYGNAQRLLDEVRM